MGSGFSRFREYGLNERLKVQQRIEMTSRQCPELGHWAPVVDVLDRSGPGHSLYGWTNGIRWYIDPRAGVFRADLSKTDTVAIFLNRDQKGSYSAKRVYIEATSKEAMTTLALHMDRLSEDLSAAAAERGTMDHWLGRYQAAKEMIDSEGSKFPDWKNSLSGEQRSDPLMQELMIQYQNDHYKLMRSQQSIILEAICRVAKMNGVRYLSIYKRDLIAFEDVRTTRQPFGKPMAWHIAEVMDLGDGCSNSSQTQVRLEKYLNKDEYGVYDLTVHPFVRLAPHVSLNSARFGEIEKTYDGETPILAWLADCGAQGEEW